MERSADEDDLGNQVNLRLFGGIKLESRGADGLAGLDCDRDIGFQGLLPWLQECSPDRIVVLKPSRSDLLPGGTVGGECRCKLIILGCCREISDCGQGSPIEGVG